jgi:hypothetical protein
MSEKEMEVLEQEEKLAEASLDEAKSDDGASEVPEPTTNKTDEKKKGTGDPMPKTKSGMLQAMYSQLGGMKKEELSAAYKKMMGEGIEEEEISGVKSVKEIKQISAEDINVSEDVAAMFTGEDLTEDFTSKATTIFEAAVVSKVNEILESVTIDLESDLEAEKAEIIESMSTRLDDYLEYVAEEWMKENELAVEQGIRSEIVENFMVGLRNLFAENYIDIPEEKVDLVDELANKVTELESSMNEEIEKNIELRKELVESKKSTVLRDVCEGLTESQIVKMKSLAEGVDFDGDYASKLETIKENYFASKEVEVLSESAVVDEEPLELEEETTVSVDPQMQAFMDAITRSIKK